MRDVIVIGAGGGGAVVAKELAAHGLDVLVVEGGPRHAHPRQEWSRLENDANNPLTGYLRVGQADRSKPAAYRELPQNSFLWQVSGVGGTTQHYFGNSPRAYPGVFAGYQGPDTDMYDVQHRFPFSYSDFVPYYEWAEATLPVHTAPVGTKESVYLRGCETLGLPVQDTKTTLGPSYRPQENAILPPGGRAGLTTDPAELRHPTSTGCTFCGHCFQGCAAPIDAPRNLFAKRSTDNSYIPMALTADAWSPGGKPITLVTDATVTKVRTERDVVRGVTWQDNATGEVSSEDAAVVVMCGGAVETPRLWFNSELPNPNDWVGRGFTDHYLDWTFGLFDSDVGSSKGPSSAARTDYPGYGMNMNVGLMPGIEAFAMTFSDSGIRGHYTNGRGLTGPWDGETGRLVGPELKDVLMHGLDRILNVVSIVDDDVTADNRVTLSALPADENGAVPKVRFVNRGRSKRSVRNREFLAHRAAELLRGAGATKVYRMDWPALPLHTHSTMRMGHSEADSVVDQTGETRAVKRLFIADNSALSNAAGGPNPTLTTQALATRTSEHIFQRYFGGDPWVRSQAPTVSTDGRVTRRLSELGL
ncbi:MULTISPECIES: GMC family oxidoreductase N-terminal domain-containing protein [Prauserella salsuginis group]|uniref:Choline dehydrogenase-like flavoprotein n=2 Tax=Prauserella salsuginis group TaxID=2893672 RepID=A0A839XRF1_9PSEU|nr:MULTISPECIES: GMC family oxidoreductase N-terminal domain-containing protein [Prauserella salsuginis group]MBB3665287.1 choline dehydrogenase-like flavoprotein [Prauserella sediminis]MCR3723078.1 Choline dehydrogenase [Prauserella flava]MCR3732547.1 Choline dehydrogenase [Prauserella salsuginis]